MRGTFPAQTGAMTRARSILFASLALASAAPAAPDKPNILWITSEDNCPMLGCYGDDYAKTPNLDALAARGLRYTRACSNAPVCAPARTALITGMFPATLGAQHMRSMVPLPEGMKLYPQHLREAGYYCTNNSKEDYNVSKPDGTWDESSKKAHWKNRPAGKPFFAVFNLEITHESQLRNEIDDRDRTHDPAKARVPAFHPDTPEVRANWAQHYDRLTMMDAQAARLLKEIEDAGLAGDTIVFYFGDNGCGMPRGKRWLYELGLRVPLIVHVPEKFKAMAPSEYRTGGSTDRLVSFVDFGPTVLSIAGVPTPSNMHGRAFMGPHATGARAFNFGFRNRMDERFDFTRSVEDGRWLYIRNFMPHIPQGQYLAYMFQTQTTQAWKKLFDEGKLTPEQAAFWKPKAAEELYDLAADRDQVNNLVRSDAPEARAALEKLRAALDAHLRGTRDLGFVPEAEMHRRAATFGSPFALGRDPKGLDFDRIVKAAQMGSDGSRASLAEMVALLSDPEPVVRYWGALGLIIWGEGAASGAADKLRPLLKDESPSVQIVAAEALGRFGEAADLEPAMEVLMAHADMARSDPYRSNEALNAIDHLGEKARPLAARIQALPRKPVGQDARHRAAAYPARMLDYLIPRLNPSP